MIQDADALSQFRLYAKHCIGEAVDDAADDTPDVRVLTDSPPRKRSFLSDLRSKLVGTSTSSNNNPSASQPPLRLLDYEAELNRYLREAITDWDEDPTVYWKENHNRFPLVAPVARRFLSAPASSVASEQLFSTAKIVFDSRRCRLSAHKAEMLVFLSRNLPLINYQY